METPYLATTPQRNIVLVYKRGTNTTHYLGLSGCALTALSERSEAFDRGHTPWAANTVEDFVRRYTDPTVRGFFIQLTGAAHRVLRAILNGTRSADLGNLANFKENEMATTDTTFKKPDGPVAKIHAILDKNRDRIAGGKISRKEMIDKLVEQGFSAGTAATQCGAWARDNGVQFVRPTQTQDALKAKAKAEKEAAKSKPKTKAKADTVEA